MNMSAFCPPPIVHLKNTKNILCILKIAISKSSKKCYWLRLTNFVGQAMQLELSKCKTSTISRTSRDYHNTNIKHYLKAFHKGS